MTILSTSDREAVLEESLQTICNYYDKQIEEMAEIRNGGKVRSPKGKLVVWIAKELVRTAWRYLGADLATLDFRKGNYQIDLDDRYIRRVRSQTVANYIRENRERYMYSLGCDVQVYSQDQFLLAIECKSYTEVAMLKRVLIDATLLRRRFPNLQCVLLQLESQLGGDYSDLTYPPLGSESGHTVMSHFEVPLTVITLLRGERHVDRPIHKEGHYKPLELGPLRQGVQELCSVLSRSGVPLPRAI